MAIMIIKNKVFVSNVFGYLINVFDAIFLYISFFF